MVQTFCFDGSSVNSFQSLLPVVFAFMWISWSVYDCYFMSESQYTLRKKIVATFVRAI